MILIRVRVDTKTSKCKAQCREQSREESWDTICRADSEIQLGILIGRWLDVHAKQGNGSFDPYDIKVEEVSIVPRRRHRNE